jgi:hypothetical protein
MGSTRSPLLEGHAKELYGHGSDPRMDARSAGARGVMTVFRQKLQASRSAAVEKSVVGGAAGQYHKLRASNVPCQVYGVIIGWRYWIRGAHNDFYGYGNSRQSLRGKGDAESWSDREYGPGKAP